MPPNKSSAGTRPMPPRACLWMIGAISLLALLARLGGGGYPLLTEVATRVPIASDAQLIAWMGEHQALIRYWREAGVTFFLFDTLSRQKKPLPALARAMKQSPIIGASHPMPSPDGSLLLWPYAEDLVNCCTATPLSDPAPSEASRSLHGSKSLWPFMASETGFWMPDSKHWIVVRRRIGAATPRLDATLDMRALIVGSARSSKELSIPLLGGSWAPIGVLKDGSILLGNSYSGSQQFALYHVQGAPRLLREFRVAVSPAAFIERVILSPDGTTLVWSVHIRPAFPDRFAWLFERLHARLPADEPQTQLWISDIDGKGMRVLGWLPTYEKDASNISNQLKWLPDSRHVGFHYDNHYWLLPTR